MLFHVNVSHYEVVFKQTQVLYVLYSALALAHLSSADKLNTPVRQYTTDLPIPSGVLPRVFSLFLSSECDCMSLFCSSVGSLGLRSRSPLPSVGSTPCTPESPSIM